MEQKKFQVAVIIINFNTSDFTINCVKSIREKTKPLLNYQIIIVDNNSRKDDFEKLSCLQKEKNLQIFSSKMNGGFSLGNMLGVNLADAKYYYFLNNDTLLLNDCLDILYQFSENNPQVGICSGQMFNKDDQKQLNFSYLPRLSLKFLGTGILRIFEPNRYPNKRKFYEEPLKVEVLNGSSMFVRSEIFDKIGGFDINYFLYCEEEDLGIRLKKEGYALFLVPKAEYKHFVSQSTQQNEKLNLKLMKEFYISYFYYFRKHKGFLATKMIQLYLFFRFITKIFKNKDFARLAFFILQEPKLSQGMRMGQKIGNV